MSARGGLAAQRCFHTRDVSLATRQLLNVFDRELGQGLALEAQ